MATESALRKTAALWYKRFRSERFIYKYLIRKKVPLFGNVCPYMRQANTKIMLKDFKKVGAGGVGLVWGCALCQSGSSSFTKLIPGTMPTQPFNGVCRMNQTRGDANKLIIVPWVEENKTPCILMCMDEVLNDGSDKILRRNNLYVISYTY